MYWSPLILNSSQGSVSSCICSFCRLWWIPCVWKNTKDLRQSMVCGLNSLTSYYQAEILRDTLNNDFLFFILMQPSYIVFLFLFCIFFLLEELTEFHWFDGTIQREVFFCYGYGTIISKWSVHINILGKICLYSIATRTCPGILGLGRGTAILFKVHHPVLDVLLWEDIQCLSC